ncbi:MAG: GmrSD restriction endonuclease domain-containing protein [Sulfitobacter sp.]
MKATEAGLLQFLRAAPRFVIPIYQRTYSWTEKECTQLWEDVYKAGSDESIDVHFIGSIVYIEDGLSNNTKRAPNLVIDGQQRLTTITLLLAALADAVGDEEPVEGFTADEIRETLLTNHRRSGDEFYKLLLTRTDRDTLKAIVGQLDLPTPKSDRIVENYDAFKARLVAGEAVVETICKGLGKLIMVDIALSREHDNPQLIFESMNSTGRELSQADLIRNFVLMGLEPDYQTKLYEHYWHPMEEDFGQAAYTAHFDSFMRHYLTVRTGNIPRLGDVYEAYKAYARQVQSKGGTIEDLVKEVRSYARFYCVIALGHQTEPKLAEAFQDIRELKVDVAYPFLLEVFDDFDNGCLTSAEFHDVLRMVEAYVFRRAICSIPTNSLNKTFANFARTIDKNDYLSSVRTYFFGMKSYRRFPRDEEFIQELKTRDLYNFPRRSYWLRRFENHGRKERVHVDDYTIEHILPQDPNLSAKWRSELGPEAEQVQERWLHTLGNLTLTGYNSEYSNRAFCEKRDMKDGFKHSPLRVNEGLGATEAWNEEAIQARAAKLAKEAAKVWAAPVLTDVELASLNVVKDVPTTGYTIQDHHHLAGGHSRELFDAFEQRILALDPCVTREFLKLYVAFKAETNFADVVPQAKGLRISLNIEPQDISDPRGMVGDVTGVGRWGNGNSEVRLNRIEDLSYVVGLARQALERQMDQAEAA